MSKCFITGAAGFIGSTVAERLLHEGHQVTGVDCFTDYYPTEQKKANIKNLLQSDCFNFLQADISTLDLKEHLQNVDYIFHFAAQPGVRDGFGKNFDLYMKNNIVALKHMLDAAKDSGIRKFVFASSSSVYGQQQQSAPVKEDAFLKPLSLYGASKLNCEHMCNIYHHTFHVPVISLRFFSVYGPKQRPDMAFHKFIRAAINEDKIIINGDGTQCRDFTYISDIVDANILAMQSDISGEAFNVGNGNSVSINDAIKMIEQASGTQLEIEYRQQSHGDVDYTLADISRAKSLLGYKPRWNMADGIAAEYSWLKQLSQNMPQYA
ncbi:NAD-dependent epimerase/dehydratase family protein [Chitinophagaceae bacterium MMS25-I14]